MTDTMPGGSTPTALDARIRTEMLAGGTLQWRDDTAAIIERERRCRHGLHALATLLTGGVWAIAWAFFFLTRKERLALDTAPDGAITHRWLT